MIGSMRLRSLVLPMLLLAAAVKLVELAATRNGVGSFEYVTVAALVLALLLSTFRLLRRALHA